MKIGNVAPRSGQPAKIGSSAAALPWTASSAANLQDGLPISLGLRK